MSTSTTFASRLFFDGHTLRENAAIVVDADGRVSEISFDARDHDFALISVGLVDIQMNGFDGFDLSDPAEEIVVQLAAALRSRGTFRFLATLVSAGLDDLLDRARRLDEMMSDHPDSGCAGIHLEGPFLGDAPGAHQDKYIVNADSGWIGQLPPTVRMMTIAPENSSCVQAIHALVAANIVPSLGHSSPSFSEYDAAVRAGARCVTHLFNAMSGVHHRDDGLASWALTDDRIAKGIIADGVHVSTTTGKLIARAVPAELRYLVSDSIAWNGAWARRRGVEIRDGAPRLPSGTLAGSSASLAECVATAVNQWHWPLLDALRSASTIPARVARLAAPRLDIGMPADFVCWDDELRVVHTVGGLTPTSP